MDQPQVAKPSTIFSNLAQILQAGMFPGSLTPAVTEAINFCNQVSAAEKAKEPADEVKTDGEPKAE